VSTIIQGYQLRTLLLGTQVIKTALTLPQTATADLFTVAGGSVLVTSLLGLVTTALGATEPLMSLGLAPTTGTAEAAGVVAASEASGGTALASIEAGSWITPGASSGLATKWVSGGHGGGSVFLSTPWVAPPGYITWTTGASDTGAITWYLTYVELDTGASVS
jgi:hypothetical protein